MIYSGLVNIWKNQTCLYTDTNEDEANPKDDPYAYKTAIDEKTAKILYEKTTDEDIKAQVLAYDKEAETDAYLKGDGVYNPYLWIVEICLTNTSYTTVMWAIDMEGVSD